MGVEKVDGKGSSCYSRRALKVISLLREDPLSGCGQDGLLALAGEAHYPYDVLCHWPAKKNCSRTNFNLRRRKQRSPIYFRCPPDLALLRRRLPSYFFSEFELPSALAATADQVQWQFRNLGYFVERAAVRIRYSEKRLTSVTRGVEFCRTSAEEVAQRNFRSNAQRITSN